MGGLKHVIERSVQFEAHVNATVKEIVERQVPLANLYTHKPEEAPKKKVLRRSVEEALEAPASPYDSHPAPADRIPWVLALDAPAPEGDGDAALDAWSLFEDRAVIEANMTAEIRSRVHEQLGVLVKPA